MSFGFSEEILSIHKAIIDAERDKDRKILFFAAATNDGLNKPEMFPAFHESVISVRGTRYNGEFVLQYNPLQWKHKTGLKYGTLGQKVACGWYPGRLVKSGCSVATPIMVTFAATLIRLSQSPEHRLNTTIQENIRRRRGMLAVFDAMTEDQGDQKRYLAPWQLLDKSDQQIWAMINNVLTNKIPQ